MKFAFITAMVTLSAFNPAAFIAAMALFGMYQIYQSQS